MAKRKAKKHHSRRRRRVGAIGGDGMKMVLGAAVGGIVGTIIGNKLTTLDEKIKGGAMLVLGYLGSKQSNPLVKGASLGIAAVGGFKLGAAFLPASVISGIGEMTMLSGFEGYPNNPAANVIGGFNNYPNNPPMNVISGINPGVMLATGAGLTA